MVKPLTRKLLRDLGRMRSQAAAIALVIAAGVGMVIMSFGMIRSLEATRLSYYERYRFAELFAPVRRAPVTVMRQVRLVPGIGSAEDRISAGAILDIPGITEPVTARLLSLPAPGGLNQLVLRSGRLPRPESPGDVVINEAFAKAARLAPGGHFSALIYGKRVDLMVTGIVLSPEYVYAVAPGQVFPDNRRFGVVWMEREPLAAALNMRDSFNEVVASLGPGAHKQDVIRRLDRLLAPYGPLGAFGRELQISDRFVSNEIDQLATMTQILPAIFLGVAAFLLNIVLARLIDTEREAIGLLKAFGYRDRAIILHYGQLTTLLSASGLVLGALLGTLLGRGLAGMYQRYFVFPFLEFHAGIESYLAGAIATLTAALLGAFIAVRRAARLTPAEAMRPPIPPDFSGVGRMTLVALDEPSRMVIRNLARRPLRTGLTILGLSSAMALYIASASATDNVDRMVNLMFGRAERADLIVAFAEPRDARALHELERLPGVLRAEPFRVAGARLINGQHVEREALSGSVHDSELSRLVDLKGQVVDPPPAGAIISSRLARRLDVRAGDRIRVEVTEGDRPSLWLEVAAIVDTPLGSSAKVDSTVLNRLLREGATLSGVYLAIDAERRDQIMALLKQTPEVAGVTSQGAVMQGVEDTVAEQMGIVTLFNTGFAGLIVLGVVYNSSRISLSEHARDLASMRVLGFRRGEVAFIILGELGLLVLLTLPLGILLGVGLSRYISQQFSADLYTIPFGYNPQTLAQGVLVIMAAAAGTASLIRSRVDRLDLIRALKTRE